MIFTKKAVGLHAIRLLLNSDSFKTGVIPAGRQYLLLSSEC